MNIRIRSNRDRLTIVQNNLKFDVTADGTIYQPLSVNSFTLDEVRLEASKQFLEYDRLQFLTKEQVKFWQAVFHKTEIMNFGRSRAN